MRLQKRHVCRARHLYFRQKCYMSGDNNIKTAFSFSQSINLINPPPSQASTSTFSSSSPQTHRWSNSKSNPQLRNHNSTKQKEEILVQDKKSPMRRTSSIAGSKKLTLKLGRAQYEMTICSSISSLTSVNKLNPPRPFNEKRLKDSFQKRN